MTDRKSSALIHSSPVMFTPELARIVGVNAAIVIQHLEFLLKVPKNGREIDGEKWVFNTYDDWQSDHFPFWSKDTIKRTFWQLEHSGLVASCQPDGRASRQKYYRVSDAGYAFLNTKNLPPKLPSNPDEGNLHPSAPEEGILPRSEEGNLPPSCARASNLSASTTASTNTLSGMEKKAAELYDAYPRKKDRKYSITAIRRALKKESFETLLASVMSYREKIRREGTDLKYVPYASKWFNSERWLDEDALPGKPKTPYNAASQFREEILAGEA